MRLVIDTNVVLDLVVFDDPVAQALRAAIESKLAIAVASPSTLAELRRVLAYPEFKLDPGRQESAYDWYAGRVEITGDPPSQGLLPRCSDPDDQKFLELAWAAGAAYLVTKDRALLALARRVAKLGRFLVSSPTDCAWPTG